MDYRPRQKARFASLEMGKTIEDTRERLRALLAPVLAGQTGDKAQQFIWGSLSEMCLYAARRVPEISDSRRRRRSRHALGFCLGAGSLRTVGRARRAMPSPRSSKKKAAL